MQLHFKTSTPLQKLYTYIAHALGMEGRLNVLVHVIKKRLCPPRPNAVDWNYCNIHYVISVCTIVILINIRSAQHLQKLYRNIKSETCYPITGCFLIKLAQCLAVSGCAKTSALSFSVQLRLKKLAEICSPGCPIVPMLKSASQVPNVLWKHIILQVPKNIQVVNMSNNRNY